MNGLFYFVAVVLLCSCAGRAAEDAPAPSAGLGGSPGAGGAHASTGGAPRANSETGGAADQAANAGVGGETAAAAGGAVAWVVSAEDCPGDPGVEPAAAPTCTAAVEKCSVYGAIPDSCNFSPFSVTVARVAEKCGINCGFISLELQSTCVAAINFSSIGTMQAQAHVAAEACMNAKLVGTRWDCAPDAGWISVYIGSCTLL